MFDRAESTGKDFPESRSSFERPNFWMVEKMIPPDWRPSSRSRSTSRESACTGGSGSGAPGLEAANVSSCNWSSNWFRSVSTMTVGFAMSGWRITWPA